MSAPAGDERSDTAAGERLQRTIDILCEDAARVELWACALHGFAQTVPEYRGGAFAENGRENKPGQA